MIATTLLNQDDIAVRVEQLANHQVDRAAARVWSVRLRKDATRSLMMFRM